MIPLTVIIDMVVANVFGGVRREGNVSIKMKTRVSVQE